MMTWNVWRGGLSGSASPCGGCAATERRREGFHFRKDTYGVFSDLVDINELPNYFEVIKQPMDFRTARKKLKIGAYKSLQELEARSIQDFAKRGFENLRHEGVDGEPQPKVVRRGRPPNSKNQKKLLETPSPINHGMGLGLSLPAAEDKANGSSSYNLRKAPPLNRFRSSDIFVPSYKSRNGANYSKWLANWNDEFPGCDNEGPRFLLDILVTVSVFRRYYSPGTFINFEKILETEAGKIEKPEESEEKMHVQTAKEVNVEESEEKKHVQTAVSFIPKQTIQRESFCHQ
ncbi:bromodomain and phd finger-containing protein 3 [Phtheirospermum japonicum]|uniref:Bromodomain and phd finger-containing protein 3 n=1 Tax=Phtheirospermum japonicum TaxID=374723 RepID=A0A830C2F7_9LAMI|nr:bromodomain and phd finger-containing protein 3 [Phtheirospermum japonicum]